MRWNGTRNRARGQNARETVRESYRYTIGCVRRLWRRSEAEQLLHHELDLILRRLAMTDDGTLHGRGCVFCHGNVAQRGREQYCAARVTEYYRRAHVASIKDPFHRHRVRLMPGDDVGDPLENVAQAVREIA